MNYFKEIFTAISDSVTWVLHSVFFQVPWYQNYFWGLVLISLIVWGLEILFPWRKTQKIIRKDFSLDVFYMFFNFFLFTILISGFYKGISMVLSQIGIEKTSFIFLNLNRLPQSGQLFVFFVVLDFVKWFTHVLLHKFSFFWQFHQIHHSVKEMGFAAHLRYHWMENILYKPFKTLAVMLLGGFEPDQAYIVHFIAITIGHLNHSNIKITWGPLKYVLNNPVMHLYHHAYQLPKGKFGVNFGISLSVWDYLFKTNYIPEESGAINIGFKGEEKLPKSFVKQVFVGFKK